MSRRSGGHPRACIAFAPQVPGCKTAELIHVEVIVIIIAIIHMLRLILPGFPV